MAEPKPFASLSSGLLARKGAAKPAMRPQGFGQIGTGLEDLGWNDMGHSQPPAPSYTAQPEHVPSSIAALTPAPRQPVPAQPADDPQPPFQAAPEAAPPPVVEQQRAVIAAFEQPPSQAEQPQSQEPQSPAAQPQSPARQVRRRAAKAREQSVPGAKNKAAFTLRLDPDRHLKLRLACAVGNRSAQQIVTEALDDFLDSLPEIGAIASHVPASAGGHRE